MFGAVIDAVPHDAERIQELGMRVRSFPDVEIRVSTTYAAEQSAIARSRIDLPWR